MDIPGGGNSKTRYIDVVGRHGIGKFAEHHQIGKDKKSGSPVSPELKTSGDIKAPTKWRSF